MYYHNYLMEYLLIFFSMAIHETAHIVAAAVQKRILVSVRITALGLNAVIKEKHDVDANRFLINISGPCANILMFFICIIIKTYYFNAGYNMRFFIYANICLALFNMLPILPLDGGRILKDVLVSKMGLVRGCKYTRRLSLIFSALLLVLGIFQYIISKYNFSILLIAGYMLYFQKSDRPEEILMNIRNLLFKRSRFLKKGVYPGRELVVLESTRLGELIKSMDFDRFHIIYVVNENMRVVRVFTEQEIIDYIMKYNADISFRDLMETVD
ncbi:MAG TPA: peptidase M50 [Hungateiclostridium thermocellum]|jgi:stage IV sporulation protein FB|uniref:Peptidase M50 n=3 Tax=Acetivibrio thermocellus TaxID=1515 RepID=A3DBL0_ACET2|nr:peptidase M50 [Acetivibrio thermocellus ATCC 27405]THJ78421.1 peptidase M50 [Acetivibrio thermocellus]HBW26724.1 peptidase M50 [Acetivibrio thermocellus]